MFRQYASATFVKVDTDVNKEIASRFKITGQSARLILNPRPPPPAWPAPALLQRTGTESDGCLRCSIAAMPTFIFLRSASEVDRLRGADPARLTALVKTLSGPTPEGGWPKGKGNILGGGGGRGASGDGDGWLGAMNPLLVLSFIFFVGPWLYSKLV